jgi:NADPH:quinone reductase-like Zn-dependent oxidoreductase
MKAVRIHAFGGAEVLQLEELAGPQPQAGEMLVKVAAASINPAYWKIRQGSWQTDLPQRLPLGLGSDSALVFKKCLDFSLTMEPGE